MTPPETSVTHPKHRTLIIEVRSQTPSTADYLPFIDIFLFQQSCLSSHEKSSAITSFGQSFFLLFSGDNIFMKEGSFKRQQFAVVLCKFPKSGAHVYQILEFFCL